jgi:exodeoxyribonuclease VII large subunit
LPTPREQIGRKTQEVRHCFEVMGRALRHAAGARELRLERVAAGLRPRMLTDLVRHHHHQLDSCGRLLESYSYAGVLARGFALVRDAAGNPLVGASMVVPGHELRLQFHDGEIAAVAEGAPRRRTGAKARTATDADDQGSLL